jgi:transcriptional regulator with GAF, ATPase, and Fis domain
VLVVEVQILGELAQAMSKVTSLRAVERVVEETLARYPAIEDPAFREALQQVIDAAKHHVEALRRVAEVSRKAHHANRELRDQHKTELVARSEAMREVMNRIELVARHPTTVLLLGESGTGKEVVARELHRRSHRRAMEQLNCGALPEALIEAELFGCERGAFTGAERRAGAFERADRGTLLLDEIGELSLGAQAKLLRVLQERRVRRVGGEQEIAIDVRVIAATNRDLRAMVRAGAFREDLLYRLDVFSIAVPPLRERHEDLPVLVATIARQLAEQLDLPMAIPDLARLAAHDWPGNVRELRNAIETAMILGGQLPAQLGQRASGGIDGAVRGAIEAALVATGGKLYGRDGAAARLGIPPTTLQSKMKKLGIARTSSNGSTTRR